MLLIESLMQMLTIKKDKEEKMVHYTQHFKQAQDNLIQYTRANALDNFIEMTQEYKLASNDMERTNMKKKAVKDLQKQHILQQQLQIVHIGI